MYMRDDPRWPAFVVWADENGVNTDNDEDPANWWDCWLHGWHSREEH
jgi:hypothetical protein